MLHEELLDLSKKQWRENNLETIRAKLQTVLALDNFKAEFATPYQGILLCKFDNIVEYYCYDKRSKKLSQVMSQILLDNPLLPTSSYVQGMLLAAFLRHYAPGSAYIAGFGGGRLAMILRHCFPEMQIDGSELDQKILDFSQSHFGISFDDKMDISADDCCRDIKKRRNQQYDLILIDGYVRDGKPVSKVSKETFLGRCINALTDKGVLCVNLVNEDPHCIKKIDEISSFFQHTALWINQGNQVLYVSNTAFFTKALEQNLKRLDNGNILPMKLSDTLSYLRQPELST